MKKYPTYLVLLCCLLAFNCKNETEVEILKSKPATEVVKKLTTAEKTKIVIYLFNSR